MDGYERMIDVRDIEKECTNCVNHGLKKLTTACSQCMCKILEDKLETEKRAYLEREKKNGKSE